MQMPAVFMAVILSSPVSTSAGGLMAWKLVVPGAGHPFRSKVAQSIRLRRSKQVKLLFDGDDTHVRTHHGTFRPR
jgi:hypothetical protein